MGRIITSLKVQNENHAGHELSIDALVDTAAAYLTLPDVWRDKLGPLRTVRKVELELGNQTVSSGEICGPVLLQINGFPEVITEVLFVKMDPQRGSYEPLLGYIPLEQSQAGVDMISHRLVPIKRVDLK